MSSPIPPELSRYHRQMLLPGFGVDGQRRLADSHALLVGCGALGTVIADALARAGVGRLTIVDRDLVEFTNLQRQVLFDEADAREGRPKADAAAVRLRAVNSSIRIEPVVADVNPRNAEKILGDASVILDGTDNFQTRYLLNDLAVSRGVPLVYGGVVGTTGMLLTVLPGRTPCLRCVFPDPPAPGTSPTCDTAGVLGPMAGVVASSQAVEALKVLLGREDLIARTLTHLDLWSNARRTFEVGSIDRSHCPCCAQRRFDFLDSSAEETVSLCGADSVQVLPPVERSGELDIGELATRLVPFGEFSVSASMLRGRLSASEGGLGLTVFRDGRAIIKGTTDLSRARSAYARYVGS